MAAPVATPAGIAAVQDILKEVWVTNNLESQLLEDLMILDWIDEVTEYTDSNGLHASVPIKVGRTGGIGARGVGEQLTPADHQKPAKAKYEYKNLYLQVQVEGPVVARMETNRQAVVREIDFEVNGGIQDFKRDLVRQLHRDGQAALNVAALPGSTGVDLEIGADNYELIDKGWVWEGQWIDVGTVAAPTDKIEGAKIVSITDDETDPILTLDQSVAATASDDISLHGNRVPNDSNEIMGLEGIISDTIELGAIDPTVAGNEYWKSVVEDNAGTERALSGSLMNTTNRKIRQKGAKITDVLGGLAQQQAYYETLQSQVRFAGDRSLEQGTVEGPQFWNVTFKGDPDCLDHRIYFLTKNALHMYSAGAMAWQNQTTGGDILAWRQDYDAFVGRAAKYCNVGTDRRRSLGVLTDLT